VDGDLTVTDDAESDLAMRLASVSRQLLSAPTVAEVLRRIVILAVETIEGCDFAGILLPTSADPGTAVGTAGVVSEIDQLQQSAGEGPCLDALRGLNSVYAHDLAGEGQMWPRFGPRAVESGVRSVLAYRLFNGPVTLGALNLYAALPAAFGATDRAQGLIYAAHAGVAIAVTQGRVSDNDQTEHLRQALVSREAIGQAQGILMERERITADQAFDVLRRASQHLNVKLREIAQDVIDTGAVPARPTHRPGWTR
jgi:ANTAR domain/GAF domain